MTRKPTIVHGEIDAIDLARDIADKADGPAFVVNRGDGSYIVGVTETYANNENRHGHEVFEVWPRAADVESGPRVENPDADAIPSGDAAAPWCDVCGSEHYPYCR